MKGNKLLRLPEVELTTGINEFVIPDLNHSGKFLFMKVISENKTYYKKVVFD